MRVTESQLRKILKRMISENTPDPMAAGSGELKGSFDIAATAKILGMDSSQLKTAYSAAQSGKMTPAHNKTLADAFMSLMAAGPEETMKVANMLKKIERVGSEEK